MRFRQVHLDFHTSERIPGIGSEFSKEQFQQMLQLGQVDSITVFAKCHHGWSYHPTAAGEMHPHLDFDLLGSMIEAAHGVGVKTPVYISAGLDEKLTRRHPDWLIRGKDERLNWTSDFLQPGYHEICMNTPYLDILTAQIEEVSQHYEADGIFLDIVGVRECYCQHCVAQIRREGGDPRDIAAMRAMWEATYERYAQRTNAAAKRHKPDMPVFHNGGHIRRGRRDLIAFNTHLELESLPTGGWGYDHFPTSARYAQQLGMAFLGMTGKFHKSWGEFGGYKHPNALRYETALSLAHGARCSVGDQLHPSGLMDEATYTLIGEAYREVEEKEAWCVGVESAADVGLLSIEEYEVEELEGNPDAGAVRMLLEVHLLFDVIDSQSDFGKYRVIVLPDQIPLDAPLQAKLTQYVEAGGKLLATGTSGLVEENGARRNNETMAKEQRAAGLVPEEQNVAGLVSEHRSFAFDLGARWLGEDPFKPGYFQPHFSIAGLPSASFVMYATGQTIALSEGGVALGQRQNPYFNRDVFAFCSHQHTPSTMKDAGPAMTEGRHGIYIAWNVFGDYSLNGSLVLREMVLHALDRMLPVRTLRVPNLPAQGVVTLQKQAHERRWVQHLLYASPVRRGENVEVIEDVIPLYGIESEIRMPSQVKAVRLAPSGEALAFEQRDGVVRYTVPKVHGHQMVALELTV